MVCYVWLNANVFIIIIVIIFIAWSAVSSNSICLLLFHYARVAAESFDFLGISEKETHEQLHHIECGGKHVRLLIVFLFFMQSDE